MQFNRRKFLEGCALSGAARAAIPKLRALGFREQAQAVTSERPAVDFRYAPRLSQATICFPDDPRKSLVGQAGDLRYDFGKAQLAGGEDFATVCMFSLAGMQDDRIVRQWLEDPHLPIVHTLIERPAASLELTAFASRHAKEGRVDNVLLTISPKQSKVAAIPRLHVRTCRRLQQITGPPNVAVNDADTSTLFLVAAKMGSTADFAQFWEEGGYTLYLPHGEAAPDEPLRYFVRFPQENQSVDLLAEMLHEPDALIDEVREFWRQWRPFGSVAWSYPGKHGEFLIACARNIQQAREMKDSRLVFEVGPTMYRNLWIVDGNFLLEAARYLGYDKEADEGLLAEWAKQLPSGQIVAGGGGEHWKDTAIAIFTLVRQCELKQSWQPFKDLEPDVRRAIDFLAQLRRRAREGDSVNGRYGLLAPGFADGGIGGVRSEFTNTVWALAGLKAALQAAERLGMDFGTTRNFYEELRASFLGAAKREMVKHPKGFQYLPMLAHDDPAWKDPDPWNRPRPQTAQWAFSHAIFPGLVFDKSDPIVRGHIALLQESTQEDVPAETGWLWHESIWNYNASFAAHVYLWAGLEDWAERTFRGFLNHASPLYCWREEQPLQQALVGQDWGDMPHNWASAECVRYLRHMLLLEDGSCMRLLGGVARNISHGQTFSLKQSPTRFGRVTLELEPLDRGKGWKLDFALAPSETPERVELPAQLGPLRFDQIFGGKFEIEDSRVSIDPRARQWTAFWR
ncbi:MAG: hypothetical protein ABSG16_10755 [Candidatus Acidiferrum sp.]|jgi:hypothetical protein